MESKGMHAVLQAFFDAILPLYDIISLWLASSAYSPLLQ